MDLFVQTTLFFYFLLSFVRVVEKFVIFKLRIDTNVLVRIP